jgi:3-hydroxybutyryl-CoA dehydrogenase
MSAEITRVGVAGCGVMGAGLAETFARAGLDVLVLVRTEVSAARGERRVRKSMQRAVESGKVEEHERDAALAGLRFTTDVADLRDRQLVVEAIAEDEQEKAALLKLLGDTVTGVDAIFASTTSAIPITRLATTMNRPGRLVGAHFFNPVPVMRLVEVTPSLLTDEDVVPRVATFVTDVLGKEAVHCRDRAGFVVNTLLVPYLLAAARMVESGFAGAEDVDNAMVLGCAHPMGPLRLIDLIGVDTVVRASRALYEEFVDPAFVVPALLLRMADAGLLGRKAGRGFYTYG